MVRTDIPSTCSLYRQWVNFQTVWPGITRWKCFKVNIQKVRSWFLPIEHHASWIATVSRFPQSNWKSCFHNPLNGTLEQTNIRVVKRLRLTVKLELRSARMKVMLVKWRIFQNEIHLRTFFTYFSTFWRFRSKVPSSPWLKTSTSSSCEEPVEKALLYEMRS